MVMYKLCTIIQTTIIRVISFFDGNVSFVRSSTTKIWKTRIVRKKWNDRPLDINRVITAAPLPLPLPLSPIYEYSFLPWNSFGIPSPFTTVCIPLEWSMTFTTMTTTNTRFLVQNVYFSIWSRNCDFRPPLTAGGSVWLANGIRK
jgi:hypothetical protein